MSGHLATAPDSEDQARIALRSVLIIPLKFAPLLKSLFRFLSTRAWCIVSGVAGLEDATRWILIQVLPTDSPEIWSLILRERGSDRRTTYYVLAPTCEVLGHDNVPGNYIEVASPARTGVRSDWAAFLKTENLDHKRLLDRLHWANREEFIYGISQLWRKRALAEGDIGAEKLAIAERYVLAHVVDKGPVSYVLISPRGAKTDMRYTELAVNGLP
jgi:hypothetical protein